MKRFSYSILLLVFLGQFANTSAEEKLKIKNSTEQKVEIRIFSEKELKWIKPSIKLDAGKSTDWKVEYGGEHNFKLIMNGKEYLLGTYNLQAIIKDKKVDEIELTIFNGAAKDKKAKEKDSPKVKGKKDVKAAEDGKKKGRIETRTRMVSVTKTRTETRVRMVRRADGSFETVPYTVVVPYVEQIQQQYQVLIPEDGGKPIEVKGEKGASKGSSSNSKSGPKLVFKVKGKSVEIKDALQKR